MSSQSPALRHSDQLITLITGTLQNCLAVYSFGSQVQGTANAHSDLDLAVLVEGYVPALVLWNLSSDLADIAGCPVDLLDLRAASTVMQYQVITTGQRIWSLNVSSDLFECFVLSEKTALDTARAPLLQDIQRRGSVYGG